MSGYADTPATADTMLGLGHLINDSTGDAGLVGGIDASTNSFWNSTVVDGSTAADGEAVRKLIRTARNAASDSGNDRCDAGFTDLATYEGIEDSYQQQVRYEDVDSANAGFENVEVSKMPLFWDFDCTPGTVFGINSKYLQIVGHSGRWMQQSKFSENPVDSSYSTGGATGAVRDGRYSMITCFLQMTTRNRRRHFRINGVSY